MFWSFSLVVFNFADRSTYLKFSDGLGLIVKSGDEWILFSDKSIIFFSIFFSMGVIDSSAYPESSSFSRFGF